MDLVAASRRLSLEMAGLSFASPVTHVYNPLEYARVPHEAYLRRYGRATPRHVFLVGMNPGPWGMAQTGVPFGEVSAVRDWLGIEGDVLRPKIEHPRRPIQGFACPRREVSGARIWGWAKQTFGTPDRFFARFFVGNYCPLAFLEDSGRNRTPDKLPASEREALFAACDRALRRAVDYLQPTFVIGIGAFAESRARVALERYDVTIGRVPHPSPASPQANRDWAAQMTAALRSLGVATD